MNNNWQLVKDDSGCKDNSNHKLSIYKCNICNNEHFIRKDRINQSIVKCSKCLENHYMYSYTNKVYGQLTIQSYNIEKSNGKHHYYNCVCTCGNITIIRLDSLLKEGGTKSCGCKSTKVLKEIKTTHGLSRSRIYKIYMAMIDRCYNINNKNFYRYGDRGIYICDEWLGENGFINFYNDMGFEYEQHVLIYGEHETTIDRIDTDGPYNKYNCKWSTRFEQNNNMSTNNSININNITFRTISDVCRVFNIDRHILLYNLSNGVNIEELIMGKKMRPIIFIE